MFIVNIKIRTEKIAPEKMEELLNKHRQWFTDYFNRGDFLLAGPYRDIPYAGVIIAKCESKEALEKILANDAYYNGQLADYEVHEFSVGLFSKDAAAWKE